MAHEIKGHLISKLKKEEGVGKNGKSWARQMFIIETPGQYPKKVALIANTTSIEQLRTFKQHDLISVSYDPESREYNGKWYTDLKAFKIEADAPAAPKSSNPNAGRGTGITPMKTRIGLVTTIRPIYPSDRGDAI